MTRLLSLPVADRWFQAKTVGPGLTLITEPYVVPFMRCNIWHIRGRDRDLMVDTGMGVTSLRDFADAFLDRPVTAVATHAHADHVGCHHEFGECLVHAAEAEGLRTADGRVTLTGDAFDLTEISTLLLPEMPGRPTGPLITALPHAGFDPDGFSIRPVPWAKAVNGGEVLDLGDRSFEILHLPGHSPGGIGLWEAASGTLFSGDAVYDAGLIDGLHHSDRADYARTMHRLIELPVEIVHAGHEASFGRETLHRIARTYLQGLDG